MDKRRSSDRVDTFLVFEFLERGEKERLGYVEGSFDDLSCTCRVARSLVCHHAHTTASGNDAAPDSKEDARGRRGTSEEGPTEARQALYELGGHRGSL